MRIFTVPYRIVPRSNLRFIAGSTLWFGCLVHGKSSEFILRGRRNDREGVSVIPLNSCGELLMGYRVFVK